MNSIPTGYHGSQFRCVSAWATSGAVLVTHTNFVVNTLAVETKTARTSLHLFALAVIYVTSVCSRGIHGLCGALAEADDSHGRLLNYQQPLAKGRTTSQTLLLEQKPPLSPPILPHNRPLNKALQTPESVQVLLLASASGPLRSWSFWL